MTNPYDENPQTQPSQEDPYAQPGQQYPQPGGQPTPYGQQSRTASIAHAIWPQRS